jgi:hypothetical protein
MKISFNAYPVLSATLKYTRVLPSAYSASGVRKSILNNRKVPLNIRNAKDKWSNEKIANISRAFVDKFLR